MASSSSEAAAPVAVGEDPAAPTRGEKRTKKKRRRRMVVPQSHLVSLMRAEEFLEPLPPRDEEFLAQLREQRRQKGYVEIEVTDDEDDRFRPKFTKKPGGGCSGSGIRKPS